ncbi:trimethylamine methyltransferase family protein [Limibacillus sp. MBR-115]|uniref:trimethylamine methyltransferase family protein n=1 Tax=Limibacillus sp. MBR-115 TaxID=3156465 RepID=UPI003393FA71
MSGKRVSLRESRRQRGSASRAPGILTSISDRRIPTYDLVPEESVELIHENSMQILENQGIEFRDEIALADWRRVGADVKGANVRIDRTLLLDLVSKAPGEYIHHARNPRRSVKIGGRGMAFAPIYGSPYVRDLSGERRYACLEDFRNFVKLAYMVPSLNVSGGTVCEPTDVPVASRHLDMLYAHMTLSDKPFMGGVTSPARAADCVAMCEILFGKEFLEQNTVMTSLTNCNSPLVWDETMLSVIRVYAAANQACLISPFIMQGANTPVTTAGAFAQLNAEALAGIAYAQIIRPGAPVIYGATLSTVSMRTGAPMYGTSETQVLTFLTGQLARKYGVPMRTGGMRNGSKAVDTQAAYESAQTMLPAILAGGNFFLHSAGWLESGLSASYAKFMLDADQLTVLQRLASGVSLTEDDFALDAISEVGAGGHFLGCGHTLAHYETAFYSPQTADLSTYEQWEEEGQRDALQRATDIARNTLNDYSPPPIDEAVDEALQEFIGKRRTEIPDGYE